MQRLREFLRPRHRRTMRSVAGALAALALVGAIAAGALAVAATTPAALATRRLAQATWSQPTEQRFPQVERPTVDNPQRAPGWHQKRELFVMGRVDRHAGKRNRRRFGPARIAGTSPGRVHSGLQPATVPACGRRSTARDS